MKTRLEKILYGQDIAGKTPIEKAVKYCLSNLPSGGGEGGGGVESLTILLREEDAKWSADKTDEEIIAALDAGADVYVSLGDDCPRILCSLADADPTEGYVEFLGLQGEAPLTVADVYHDFGDKWEVYIQTVGGDGPFYVHGTLGEESGGVTPVTMQETRADVDAAVEAGREVILLVDTTEVENEGQENESTVTSTWYAPLVTKQVTEGETGYNLGFAVNLPGVLSMVAHFDAGETTGSGIIVLAQGS